MRDHFLETIADDEPFELPQAIEAIQVLRAQIIAGRRNVTTDEVGSSSNRSAESVGRRSFERAGGIAGMREVIDRVLCALLIGEHCLQEGLPGVAKTMLCKTLASMLGLAFSRIQFTPDMMPSDIISRERLQLVEGKAKIEWVAGPIFANLLLADEINRASSKVQSALLEAMEEGQVTTMYEGRLVIRPMLPAAPVAEQQLLLDQSTFFGEEAIDPTTRAGQHFMVLATMNPIEQEGVFPLSEAQLDRFAFKLIIDRATGAQLASIAEHAFERPYKPSLVHDKREHARTLYFLTRLRRLLLGEDAYRQWFAQDNAWLARRVEMLINFSHLRAIDSADQEELGRGVTATDRLWYREFASRRPSESQDDLKAVLSEWQASGDANARNRANEMLSRLSEGRYPDVLSGASPRGLLKLIRAAHANAILRGKVRPDWADVRVVAKDVLRHRIRISAGSLALGVTPDGVTDFLLRWLEK